MDIYRLKKGAKILYKGIEGEILTGKPAIIDVNMSGFVWGK